MQRSRSALLTVAVLAVLCTMGFQTAFVSAPSSSNADLARATLRGAGASAAVAPLAAHAVVEDAASSMMVAGLDDQLLQISIMTLVSTVSLSIAIVIWGRNGF
mmetsp:Transcript_23771/g.55385  ORF Transcript_23771/g.55385 Transcript_23771/m.55385 type:complete len:103 (-) Transcript_23771:58-366(-)